MNQRYPTYTSYILLNEYNYLLQCKCYYFSACHSCRSLVFHKIGVLKNFARFTPKRLFHSLFFDKVPDLHTATLSKERLRLIFMEQLWDGSIFSHKQNKMIHFPLENNDLESDTQNGRTD